MFHTQLGIYMFAGLSVSIIYWHFSTGIACYLLKQIKNYSLIYMTLLQLKVE